MTDLTPLTALGTTTPWSQTMGRLCLSETPELALASLALSRDTPPPTPFGMLLPGAGQCVFSEPYGAFWMGPNQWMVEGHKHAHKDFAAELKTEAPGTYVTEQTDAWCAFDIIAQSEQNRLPQLMQKLVNLDAHAFVTGCATRTGLEHMNVFLIRRADTHLTVIGMRSLAGSLKHAICTAAQRLEQ